MIARWWWSTSLTPAFWEAEAGVFLTLRPGWPTEQVPGCQHCTKKPCLKRKKKSQQKIDGLKKKFYGLKTVTKGAA